MKLISKKEYRESKDASNEESLEVRIIEALGGKENIESISACATRLRVTVKDESQVASDDAFKNHLEAMGVVHGKNSIQIIYGVRVGTILTKINDIVKFE